MMENDDRPVLNATEPKPPSRYRYRSAFWGVVLIGVGVVLLLANFDIISGKNLAMLALLWPILIVGIGVDLLFGRKSWAIGGLVGVVTAGLIIVFMLLGPGLGWVKDRDLRTEKVTTPVGQATSAQIVLDSSSYGANIHALAPSNAPDRPLLDATVTYEGSIDFESSGDTEKTVSIETKGNRWWWGWLDLEDSKPWDVGLDPSLPLSLSVESSSGSSDLDLSGLRLSGLELRVSSGDTQVALPALDGQKYPAELQLSSGDLRVEVADGAQIDMSVDMSSGDTEVALGRDSDVSIAYNGSSGAFTVELAAGQAVRVEVQQISSGDVDVPSGLVQVTKGDDDEGVWESQGYSTATHKVHVVIEHMSSGDVEVHQGG